LVLFLSGTWNGNYNPTRVTKRHLLWKMQTSDGAESDQLIEYHTGAIPTRWHVSRPVVLCKGLDDNINDASPLAFRKTTGLSDHIMSGSAGAPIRFAACRCDHSAGFLIFHSRLCSMTHAGLFSEAAFSHRDRSNGSIRCS
jgi:hypothetical protein